MKINLFFNQLQKVRQNRAKNRVKGISNEKEHKNSHKMSRKALITYTPGHAGAQKSTGGIGLSKLHCLPLINTLEKVHFSLITF